MVDLLREKNPFDSRRPGVAVTIKRGRGPSAVKRIA